MSNHPFFTLLRGGLWEDCEEFLLSDGFKFQKPVDWGVIYQWAQEQSLLGLIMGGIEKANVRPPTGLLLQWIGEVQILEAKNKEMNAFIASFVRQLRNEDVQFVLVKGQGVAQCYERPLWRVCGDVDLLLDNDNYERTKLILSSMADKEDEELVFCKHKAYYIGQWEIELHGNLRGRFLSHVDDYVDQIQDILFAEKKFRIWDNEGEDVSLPNPDDDVVFVFVHILQHLFAEGIGLRQICDWCRLLWVFRESLDLSQLELRLKDMSLMSEWKSFASLAVEYLGMPYDAMPFYSSNKRWKRNAKRLIVHILETGNFGHNRDLSYFSKYPYILRKVISLFRHTRDGVEFFMIFPLDSLRVWRGMVVSGLRFAMRGQY